MLRRTPLYTPGQNRICSKYTQVETVIFGAMGVLTGSAPNSTGYDTQDREKILAIDKVMFTEWGTYKTADQYVKKFLLGNISPKALSNCDIGVSLRKQVELIRPYANAMDREFKKDSNYKTINSDLESYLQQTGTNVSSISWLELMSVTGIVHGSTFSMTRLSMSQSIVSVNSFQSDTFTARDVGLMSVLTATVLGTREEFYVFSDALPASYPYNIKDVLLAYDIKTADLKAQYQKEITAQYQKEIKKDPAVYKTFGWILSDHGPNFLDGKQLTLITYFKVAFYLIFCLLPRILLITDWDSNYGGKTQILLKLSQMTTSWCVYHRRG